MAERANPYFIEGPALLAVSGGRTSGKMLKRILDAHGGSLPPDVHAVFCNTGKEREETLRFVHDMQTYWSVPIRWLEWRDRRKRTPAAQRFEEVGFNSAARNGEPFKALIASKKAVPNAYQRWCTTHLKFQFCADFMEVLGYPAWKNVVGLRRDEQWRVMKKAAENVEQNNIWTNVMPLDAARVTKRDVLRFWFGKDKVDLTMPAEMLPQGFDLGLNDWEGNCTKCFMKPKAVRIWDIKRDPADARDWADMEKLGGGTFVTEHSVDDLISEAADQRQQADMFDPNEEFDAECGTWCEPLETSHA